MGILRLAVMTALVSVVPAHAGPADWPSSNKELDGQRFSPLVEINAGNVGRMREAWVYHMKPADGSGGTRLVTTETVPLVVGDMMFVSTPYGRVVALDRTSALLAGTASTMLRFKTDQALPPALAAQARVTGRIVQLKAHDAAEVEQHLAALRQAGIAPEDLEIGRADLEDVFVQIMSGAHPASAPAQLPAHPAPAAVQGVAA